MFIFETDFREQLSALRCIMTVSCRKWKTKAYSADVQIRCIFVVSPLLSVRYPVRRSIFSHLLHQDVLWYWCCQGIKCLFCCLWYSFPAILQKFSESFHSLTICWISCKLCANFHTFLAMTSICSHFLWCTATHTWTDNLICLVSSELSTWTALFLQTVFSSFSYLYFNSFLGNCQYFMWTRSKKE